MKKDRYEVILAGSGGQGLVMSGIMLAEAAILEGKNVVQTVSYGIASRGGFSMAEVIIDREEIIFQQVQEADVVLVLTEVAMERFERLAKEGVAIFYDSTLLKARQGRRYYGQPFTEMASRMGNVGMANVIALGCLAQQKRVVKTASLAEVIGERFCGAARDANLLALQAGIDLAV